MLETNIKDFLEKGDATSAVNFMTKCVESSSSGSSSSGSGSSGVQTPAIGILAGEFFVKYFPRTRKLFTLLASCYMMEKMYRKCYDICEKMLKTQDKDNIIFMNLMVRCVEHITDDFIFYNYQKISEILNRPKNPVPMITFSITTCKRYDLFEKTMNSFINCCSDIMLIDRWLCVDDNSSEEDRQKMRRRYPFFEFIFKEISDKGHPRSMNIIRESVKTPYLFHMEDDWKFFSENNYLTQCLDVLSMDDNIGQCLINFNYAETEKDFNIAGGFPKTAESGQKYMIHEHCSTKESYDEFNRKYKGQRNCAYWPHFSFRPSLLRRDVLEKIGAYNESANHFEMEYSNRYVSLGFISAFLRNIYCIHTGRLTSERNDTTKLNAYDLNNEKQFSGKSSGVGDAKMARPEDKSEGVGDAKMARPELTPQRENKSNITQGIPLKNTVPENVQKTDVNVIGNSPVRIVDTTETKSVQDSQRKKILYKTVIVNLNRRTDRWQNMKRKLEQQDINHERYSAVDGLKLVPTEQLQRLFDGNDFDMNSGMVGCALSHLDLAIKLLQSNYDAFCIIEDDVDFSDGYKNKLEGILDRLPINWDICYLGYHLWKQHRTQEYLDHQTCTSLEKWNTQKSMAISMGGTTAYLLSKSGAKKFLDFINERGMTNCIDTMQQKFADEGNVYYTKPMIVFSQCFEPNSEVKSVDSDILGAKSGQNKSLTIPIDYRLKQETDFYKSPEIQKKYGDIMHLSNPDQFKNICSDKNHTRIAFYYGPNIKEYLKTCIHPCYSLGYQIMVVVPNPSQEILNVQFFQRLYRGMEKITPTIQNCLVFQMKMALVNMSPMSHVSEAIQKLYPENQKYPFDKIDGGNFEKYADIVKKVMVADDDTIRNITEEYCSPKSHELSKNYKGDLTVINRDLEISFPHDSVNSIMEDYTNFMKNLRNNIRYEAPIIFINCTRWEKTNVDSLVNFMRYILTFNANCLMLCINSVENLSDIPEAMRKYFCISHVPFPEKFRTADWPMEKIGYDQNSFRVEIVKPISELLEKIGVKSSV